MSALAVVPASSEPSKPIGATVYQMETALGAYLDTAPLVKPEEEEQFLRDFYAALSTSVDEMGHRLAHLQNQADFAKAEIVRLRALQSEYEAALESESELVVKSIRRNCTPDKKGKYPTLEGKTVVLGLRKCPASVEITAPEAIPEEHVSRTVSVKVPAALWETVLDALDFEVRNQILDCKPQPDATISKTALKKALEAGTVPGATLIDNRYSLTRK